MNVCSSCDEALQELLRTTVNYILSHAETAVDRFKPTCRESLTSTHYNSVAPRQLPASALLQPSLELAAPETRPLLACYETHREHLFFEQSYSTGDTAISEQMLAGYGFAEIVGERGPFISDAVRIGIGIWDSNIDYPIHQHQAEEVYIVLAGSAAFFVDDCGSDTAAIEIPAANYAERGAGDVVWVPSNSRHGFRTTEQLVVVLYIWQLGDLRQKSTFESDLS